MYCTQYIPFMFLYYDNSILGSGYLQKQRNNCIGGHPIQTRYFPCKSRMPVREKFISCKSFISSNQSNFGVQEAGNGHRKAISEFWISLCVISRWIFLDERVSSWVFYRRGVWFLTLALFLLLEKKCLMLHRYVSDRLCIGCFSRMPCYEKRYLIL